MKSKKIVQVFLIAIVFVGMAYYFYFLFDVRVNSSSRAIGLSFPVTFFVYTLQSKLLQKRQAEWYVRNIGLLVSGSFLALSSGAQTPYIYILYACATVSVMHLAAQFALKGSRLAKA